MVKHPGFGRTYISFDWALKRLLRNKASFVILEGFLSELLKQDILVKNLLESEANAEAEDDKINRLDLLCENHRKELIIIEVQYHFEMDYFQRMLFGTAVLLTQYIQRGQPYSRIRKVYSVNILYFDLGQGTDYIYHGRLHFTGMHGGDQLRLSKTQQQKFGREEAGELYPEYYILKINNFDQVASNTLDEWIYYLKTSELPAVYHAKGLAEVEKQLKINAMSPDVKAKYMKLVEGLNVSESMIESAYEEGEFNGIEKGIEKGLEKSREYQERTVINAFQKDLSVELISTILSLSPAEVKAILRKQGLLV